MYTSDRPDQTRLKYKESTNDEERDPKRLKAVYSPSSSNMQSFTLTAVSSGVTLRHQDELVARGQENRYRDTGRASQQQQQRSDEQHLTPRDRSHQRIDDIHQERMQQRGEEIKQRSQDNNSAGRSRMEEDRDEDIQHQFTPPANHQDRRIGGSSGAILSGNVGNIGISRSLGPTPPALERSHDNEAINLGRTDSRSAPLDSRHHPDSGSGPAASRSAHADNQTETHQQHARTVFKEPHNLQESMIDGIKDDVNNLRMDYESPDESCAAPSGTNGGLVDRSSILEYNRNMEIGRYGKDPIHREYTAAGPYDHKNPPRADHSGPYDHKGAPRGDHTGPFDHKNTQRGDQYQAAWRSRGADTSRRMTNTADQYCLRWNSYESNILDTFGGLLDSEALSDVTLFCEGESFKAHRLVLAACSTHFSKIFSSAPLNGQLIVILDGTRAEDLQILLQFMYRGVAFLPSDRIESVLRTGEVLQVKGLFNGGQGDPGSRANRSNSTGGPGGGPNGPTDRNWSPPPVVESLKKEVDASGGPSVAGRPDRDASSPVPSGRIAVQGESPITHNLPLFPQQPYPRQFTSLPSIYPSFPFSRPESAGSKTTSSSVHSFPGAKSGGGRSSAVVSPPPSLTLRDPQFSKIPLDRDARSDAIADFGIIKTEIGKIRSPPLHRPSSEPYDRSTPRSSGAGSKHPADTDLPGSSSPSQSRRFDEQRHKTDESPSRDVSFSERDFADSAGRESRLSASSKSSTRTAADMAQDLTTNYQEERRKRENNQDFLRRLAQVNSERENQLATIQKMDLLRQATARGDHFLAGAGAFSGQLSAPLSSMPASDLARIAQTVPDPSAVPGEPTSGTGTKLKCPFCERTYGYETNLRAHIRQRHQGIRVPCPYCHRTFTRNNTVRRHIAREHRGQVNPKMIPAKFGQTKVLPDQPYLDTINALHQSSQQP